MSSPRTTTSDTTITLEQFKEDIKISIYLFQDQMKKARPQIAYEIKSLSPLKKTEDVNEAKAAIITNLKVKPLLKTEDHSNFLAALEAIIALIELVRILDIKPLIPNMTITSAQTTYSRLSDINHIVITARPYGDDKVFELDKNAYDPALEKWANDTSQFIWRIKGFPEWVAKLIKPDEKERATRALFNDLFPATKINSAAPDERKEPQVTQRP